jgi:hypothetical protein
VRELSAIVAGDIASNDVHANVAASATDHDKRIAWIDTLSELAKLKPEIVVARHRRPDAPASAAVLPETATTSRTSTASLSREGALPR